MLEKIKQILKNLFKDNPEAQKLIDDNLKEEDFKDDKTPTTKYDKEEISKATVDQLLAKNEELLQMLKSADEDRKRRDEALKEEAQTAHTKKVKEAIEKAIKEGKIPSQNEDVRKSYEALLIADFSNGSKIIEALPSVTKSENTENKQNSNYQALDKEAELLSRAKSEITSKLQTN